MKSNEHKIKTIQDIVDVVTPENLDNFIIDFKMWLTITLEKKNKKQLHTFKLVDREKVKINITLPVELVTSGFTWIDDGKHEKKEGYKIVE